jgi:hypothetical protein
MMVPLISFSTPPFATPVSLQSWKGDQLKKAIKYFLDDKVREQVLNRAKGKAEIHDKKSNFDQMIGIFKEAAKS